MADSKDEMPPWLTPVDEIDTAGPDGIFSGNMKKVVVSVAIIVVAIFVVAMWLMYDRPADDFEQPVEVLADMSPIKVKPEETGGKEILDQDKDVFKRLTGDGDEKRLSSLAQEAEEPLSELPADQEKQEIKKEPEVIEKSLEKVIEKPIVSPKKKPTVIPEKKPVPEKTIREKLALVAPVAADKHKVQLGAYSTQEGAAAFWKEMKAKMPNVFAGMRDEYVPLTRNGRTLYRLRVGPVENRAAADRLCLQLKAKKQACMVVDPK